MYKMFDSQRFKTIWSLWRDTWNGVITLDHAHKEQVNKNWLCLLIILKDVPGQKIKTIKTENKSPLQTHTKKITWGKRKNS